MPRGTDKVRFMKSAAHHPFLLFFFICVWVMVAVSDGLTNRFEPKVAKRTPEELARRDFMAVCPPFYLRDEDDAVIDPVHGLHTRPYSPKQTCGTCHDYDLITSACHFQQRKDEVLSSGLKTTYPWMLSPGQYRGRY